MFRLKVNRVFRVNVVQLKRRSIQLVKIHRSAVLLTILYSNSDEIRSNSGSQSSMAVTFSTRGNSSYIFSRASFLVMRHRPIVSIMLCMAVVIFSVKIKFQIACDTFRSFVQSIELRARSMSSVSLCVKFIVSMILMKRSELLNGSRYSILTVDVREIKSSTNA